MSSKKYTPSVRANNEIKETILKKARDMLYNLERTKSKKLISEDVLNVAVENIKNELVNLENSIGMGKEDLKSLPSKIYKQIDLVKMQSEQVYVNRFEDATDELCSLIDSFSSLMSGELHFIDENIEIEKSKISWTRRKLNSRLEELINIKMSLENSDKRLEVDINIYEKDLNELDNLMLNEDNERKINELFRKISAVKSKIEMLSSHRSNYSACYNLLDMIYENAKEIVKSGEFSIEELSKAKALLDMSKLKGVLSNPDKVISILNIMKDGIKKISVRTANIDSKVFDINTGEREANKSAQAYKEELLRKKREKEGLNKIKDELENVKDIFVDENPEIKEV